MMTHGLLTTVRNMHITLFYAKMFSNCFGTKFFFFCNTTRLFVEFKQIDIRIRRLAISPQIAIGFTSIASERQPRLSRSNYLVAIGSRVKFFIILRKWRSVYASEKHPEAYLPCSAAGLWYGRGHAEDRRRRRRRFLVAPADRAPGSTWSTTIRSCWSRADYWFESYEQSDEYIWTRGETRAHTRIRATARRRRRWYRESANDVTYRVRRRHQRKCGENYKEPLPCLP